MGGPRVSDQTDELASALMAHLLLSALPPPSSPAPAKKAKEETKPSEPSKKKKDNKKGGGKQVALEVAAAGPAAPAAAPFDRWTLADESTIDYGCFSQNNHTNTPTTIADVDPTKPRFYITTAINYTNGPAHMGHAYEAATSDAIARFNRLKLSPSQTYFVTGADEHGQKIANTAADQTPPIQPIDLCNKYVTGFQVLNQRILVSNNDYVRTTSDRHKNTARALWKKCSSNIDPTTNQSDIYLSKYSGWYNVREETFVTDSDAKLADYKDAASGLPLKKVEEESYFFRMSNYHDKLVKYIHDNPQFIQPEQYKNNILARLEKDKLRDLSISRTTFDWGIRVPEGFDAKHVMYVWFDALSNYLTGIDALGANDGNGNGDINSSKLWPANVHIIGKDIIWFHTVIWPCILMSASIPLPQTVFAHGFVNDKDGIKMSKSLGNVVDPHDLLDKYPVDSFRWYLCKEAPYGGELSFSEESLVTMHNADLCDTLGNLVHRVTNLCNVHCDGVIPDVPPSSTLPVDFENVRSMFEDKMQKYELNNGAEVVMEGLRCVNRYLTEQAPWKMKGDDKKTDRQIVVRATLEAVFALTHLLSPFIPEGSSMIMKKFSAKELISPLSAIKSDLRNLAVGTKILVGDVLYKKILTEEERLSAEEAKKKKENSYAEAQKRKKEKKAAAIASSKAGLKKAGAAADDSQPDFTKIEIKVGKIVKVWNHPDADKLFCEDIDVGEENTRQIASGLREHYTLSDMQDRKVLVVCNLKAAKIVGFASSGMVLAAKAEDGSKVELVGVPEGAKVGERVFIDGLSGDPFSSAQVKKKKTWNVVAKGLKTTEGGVATWDGKEIKTSAGACTVSSLVGAPIS